MRILFILVCLVFNFLVASSQSLTMNAVGEINLFGIDFELTGNPSSIVVSTVYPNSPASETELKKGDIIIAMNGVQISHNNDGLEKLKKSMRSETLSAVTFDIERKEALKHTMRVSYLLKRKLPTSIKKSNVFGIGVTLVLDTLKLNSMQRVGARIDKVYPDSPADSAGLVKGDFIVDVDGHIMDATTSDVIKQVVDWLLIDEPRIASILVLRNEHQVFTTVPFKVHRTDISKYISQGVSSFPNLNIDRHPEENQQIQLKPSEKDRDGDGILNKDDACPDEPGISTNSPFDNGCPEEKN